MAHEGIWQQLLDLDPADVARRADCEYEAETRRYLVTILNSTYIVSLDDRTVAPVEEPGRLAKLDFLTQLCLLTYLINARDLPLANRLANPETLPTGQFFFRGPHGLPTPQLEAAFQDCPDRLNRAAEALGGQPGEFGDASLTLFVLPRLPVTLIVWRGDDEFPARASILVDQTAGDQLPLDALHAALNLVVAAVIEIAAEGE